MIVPPDLWECDGSLRDVYIQETEMSDWDALFELVARYPCTYSFDGTRKEPPHPSRVFQDRSGGHLLTIQVGSASINCHFFISEEIELDIDPRQIADESTHELVMNFLAELSTRIGKDLAITPENSPASVYCRFSSSTSSWVNYAE
jgi:hypothetical protein